VNALRDPFGIIKSIDAEDQIAALDALASLLNDAGISSLARKLGKGCGLDADGIGGRLEGAAMGAEHAFAEFIADALPTHATGKVLDVVVCLEADDVIAGKTAHDLLVNGHGEEDVRGRPGNMQEETDAVPQAHLPQFGGEWNQVIVVH